MKQVSVVMFGARMNYAVPAILQSAGGLHQLYNDLNATVMPPGPITNLARRTGVDSVRRLLQRRPVGVPDEKISCSPSVALRLHLGRQYASGFENVVDAEIRASRNLARAALGRGALNAQATFTYDRAGLEVMQAAKQHNLLTIMEQTVAPASALLSLLRNEKSGVEPAVARGWEKLSDRERQEWDLADMILCGSDFVRETTIADGADPERCHTVPYGVLATDFTPRIRRRDTDRPLRLLFVGEVGFRKGASYLIDATRSLGMAVETAMVGRICHEEIDTEKAPSNVRFIGKITREEVRAWYDWADLFVLPSLFEGSATVTYEAMASGLPVICTPETGSIVRDGETGRVIHSKSTNAVRNAIEEMKPSDLECWSRTLLEDERGWDRISYQKNFLSVVGRVLA